MHPTSPKPSSPCNSSGHPDASCDTPTPRQGRGGLLWRGARWPAPARGTNLCKAGDSAKPRNRARFWLLLPVAFSRRFKKFLPEETRMARDHFPGKPGWKERENEPHSKGASSTTPLPCKLGIWMSRLSSAGEFPDLSLGKQEALNV